MNKPHRRIKDGNKAIEAIETLQNYMVKKGYTMEQVMDTIKQYWGKMDRNKKEVIVKNTCGKCVHNKITPYKPYYCSHDFVDGRRPKAILKRKGECPAYAGK